MKPLLVLTMLAAPLFAGSLALEIGNPSANPEAVAKHAVLVARMTACKSPEKTTVRATAEGVMDGARRSIPLKIVPLSAAGTYAVTREWPAEGTWAVKMVATNPDYQGYAASVLVPIENGEFQWAGVKHFRTAPVETEIAEVLGRASNK